MVGVRRDQFRVTKGQPAEYVTLSEAGHLVSRIFCGRCGTHLYAASDLTPDLCSVKVGALDEPARFKPRVQAWTSEAQPWHRKFTLALRFRKNPPIPRSSRGAASPEA